jgi:SAM-dependent methyltransferase
MKEPTHLSARQPAGYWDGATATFRSVTGGSWRRHCDALYRQLLDGWLVPAGARRALKTDLFDEAVGEGLCSELERFAYSVHGVDVAGSVAADARAGHADVLVTQADVRQLPYPDGAFELVVSNSTLDHFEQRDDIAVALRELFRVTAVGGTLVVSLDNLANPIIALRALLPFRLLRALGLVPYYVGATTTRRGLVELLEQAGYRVQATTSFLHVPRVAAVRICARSDRRAAPATASLMGRLAGWERLGRWPTAAVTGHYIAALAVRE